MTAGQFTARTCIRVDSLSFNLSPFAFDSGSVRLQGPQLTFSYTPASTPPGPAPQPTSLLGEQLTLRRAANWFQPHEVGALAPLGPARAWHVEQRTVQCGPAGVNPVNVISTRSSQHPVPCAVEGVSLVWIDPANPNL